MFRRNLVGLILCGTSLAFAAPLAAGPSEEVMQYRKQMFDEPFRIVANRSLALMFNTADVKAGEHSHPLEQRLAPLNFSYDYGGKTHAAEDAIRNTFTDGLLIMKKGRIVYEGYYNQARPDTRFNSYSAAKSINAMMVGLALKEGKIRSVTDPVTDYLPELRGTGYEGTTIRDLMEMRSGIDWVENFFKPGNLSYDAHVASWVEERERYTDTALKVKHKHQPGTFFYYNSMDAGVVGWLVERAVGMPVSRYLSERLWQPAGMESDAFYVIDGEPGVGREFTAGGFNATLRDYGRMGQFMLNEGRVGDKQLLPTGYVADLSRDITPDSREFFGYGYFWWTIRGTRAFTAMGGEGQYIFVDPETETVIVKLSHAPVGPAAAPVTAETVAFLKAASAWNGN